jgi:uncharacterized protein (UPF0216 family)
VARESQERDRFVDAVLRGELKRLNSHLPKNRRTLEDLLADSSPTVSSISGHPIRMKKGELEELSQSLPAEAPGKIRLPIVLLRRRDLGTGAFTILGDPYEEYSILLLTNGFNGTFEDFRRQTYGTVTIYKPQVSQLLRRFHSLIAIGFGTAGLEQ